MTNRVRLAGIVAPLWALLIPATCVVAIAAAALTAGLSRQSSPRQQADVPLPATSAAGATPLPGNSAPNPPADVGALESKAPFTLSAHEVLELASVTSKKDAHSAEVLRQKLRSDPALVKDKSVLAELRKLLADPDSSREALAALAELPGPLAADLLYEVWTGTSDKSDTTELARALVYSTDVRGRASLALAVALDLRLAETCDHHRAVLQRALEHGDRRSFHLLAKLKRKQGCGPNKRQDCFACLREGTELDDAIKAVKQRRAPAPFGS